MTSVSKDDNQIFLGTLADDQIEMVEHKGLGHPDTICDQIVERISRDLCRYYIKNWDSILHYNIDKALLVGGSSAPKFGGGKILEPITLIIAGRATNSVKNQIVPIEQICREGAIDWIGNNLRYMDVANDIRIECRIRPGSVELQSLFSRPNGEVPLANDTSIGAGFFPYTPLEDNVLGMGHQLNSKDVLDRHRFLGEDIKVMGVRKGSSRYFTVACAMVGKYLENLSAYRVGINSIRETLSGRLSLESENIFINTADDYKKGTVYLTVSGTSAESGDDGQVGRGNRINGLITPYRPMTLEAPHGKNPYNHVGKIYNHFAYDLSKRLVEQGYAEQAQVFLVSKIGQPIDQPQAVHLRFDYLHMSEETIQEFVLDSLPDLKIYWKKWLSDLQASS